uniref:DUF295 domain-containing protein n=1 Tax=Setaria viridis TaxID=4556 RepID=A0A4U6U4M2_SETVI|nr:hypothetical protein SEVIR_6G173900v2 [Setaria viridis]
MSKLLITTEQGEGRKSSGLSSSAPRLPLDPQRQCSSRLAVEQGAKSREREGANNNPIYFRGEFYFLGRKGNFVVFNPIEDTWIVLDKPEPIYAELNVFYGDHKGVKFCYLVELEGELISVFIRNGASFGMVSSGAGNGNKIFFPRYSEDGKHAAFYDLETNMYYPTFYGVKEPLNCACLGRA